MRAVVTVYGDWARLAPLELPKGAAGRFQDSSGLTIVDQILSVAPSYALERHKVRAVVHVEHERYRHAVGGLPDRLELSPNARTGVVADELLVDAVAIQPRGVRVAVRKPPRRHYGGVSLGRNRERRAYTRGFPCHRICAVPFTLTNIRGDLEDLGSRFDGAPDLEFRAATKALELEQASLSYQRVPPGYRFPYGHTHKTQEEVYVVVRGSGRMKVDDDILELKEWDAVRVPPGSWRGYEAGPEGLEILVIGAPNLGENPRDDVEGERDWWADEQG